MVNHNKQREKSLSLITIKNGGLTAKIAPLGATLVELWVPNKQGTLTDVVLGYDSPQEYINCTTYFGGTIAPNANRICPTNFKVNQQSYTLAKNDGENNLHSGPKDASKRLFTLESASLEQVVLSVVLTQEDTGFPGHLELWVRYTLTPKGHLDIEYKGSGGGTRVINPTNHSYFNLGGQGSVKDHTLELKASLYTPLGISGLPTGEVLKTQGTDLDFAVPKKLEGVLKSEWPPIKQSGGLDHNFILDGAGYRKVATLSHPTGLQMEMYTDRPCVQLYSGNGLGKEKGKNGIVYPTHGGLCLETQNMPNHLHFPWFTSSVYKDGETFQSKTSYQFSNKPEKNCQYPHFF